MIRLSAVFIVFFMTLRSTCNYELSVCCRKNLLESEEIVSELVHGFLLPEVAKQEMRERGLIT